MVRFTIPGRDHDLHRAGIRRDRLTRGEAWRIILTADRLHGIGLSKHPRSVHRERVRFGAWNVAGLVRVREHVCGERVGKDRHPCTLWTRHHGAHQAWEPPKPCACCQIPWAIPDEATRAAEARSGSGVGMGEGPADSGGSQTYKRPLWADSPDLAEETR